MLVDGHHKEQAKTSPRKDSLEYRTKHVELPVVEGQEPDVQTKGAETAKQAESGENPLVAKRSNVFKNISENKPRVTFHDDKDNGQDSLVEQVVHFNTRVRASKSIRVIGGILLEHTQGKRQREQDVEQTDDHHDGTSNRHDTMPTIDGVPMRTVRSVRVTVHQHGREQRDHRDVQDGHEHGTGDTQVTNYQER